jgi:hypothetical protein
MFELFLWGARAHRVVQRLRQATLPPWLSIREGSLGATLAIAASLDESEVTQLFAAFASAAKEGDFSFGITPDRPMTEREALAAWQAFTRTAHLPVEPLSPRDSTVAEVHDLGIVDWISELFDFVD